MPFLEPDEMISGEPLPGWRGRFFHSANMTFALYDLAPSAVPLHEHHHEQEEVWNVVEGAVEITVDGVTRRIGQGSAVVVPPNVRHSVNPLGPARVVVVDFPLRLNLPGMGHVTTE